MDTTTPAPSTPPPPAALGDLGDARPYVPQRVPAAPGERPAGWPRPATVTPSADECAARAAALLERAGAPGTGEEEAARLVMVAGGWRDLSAVLRRL